MTLPLHNASFWALATCIAAAVFEGISSGTGVKARLTELQLPKGAPNVSAWAIIGAAYYILFFLLLRSALDRPPVPFWTFLMLIFITALLMANASWNWIFFRKKDLWLSLVFFVPYLLLSLALAWLLHHVHNPFSGWYDLYLVYLVYATWWGYRVWRLNSSSSQNS